MQLVQTEAQQKEMPELIPLSKFNEFFPYPTVSALRQYNYYKERNGFDKVVRRIGKRVYISVKDFREWVKNGTGAKATFMSKEPKAV